jgi:23S rRNA (cytosine1962-C5)-methyltransferase
VLRCVIFEDDHLLAVNKPAGMNTHAPSPYAGEGLYEWLRNREPGWATLAIIHRLDKETSGVILFAKTTLASRSLTEQFTKRSVRKRYVFLTDRVAKEKEFSIKSALVRAGEKYLSRPLHAGCETAETKFRILDQVPALRDTRILLRSQKISSSDPSNAPFLKAWIAEPTSGRTHQIRVHAAGQGLPILGDILYGGTAAARVYLHASELSLKHPATGEGIMFQVQPDFQANPRMQMREQLIDAEFTNSFRAVHGSSDGWPGWYVERLGDFLLSQSETPSDARQQSQLRQIIEHLCVRGAYHKVLRREVCGTSPTDAAARVIFGEPALRSFVIRENGLQFEISFTEGYSTGLFLDQRDNRRRLITGYVAPGFLLSPLNRGSLPTNPLEDQAKIDDSRQKRDSAPTLLNTFAYTCAFSVCAAKAGLRTTSLDLSKKYLEWGKRNFALNHISTAGHEFICGDVFDWLRRFRKKELTFDIILLDPPTFSRSKTSGIFRVEKDYGRLLKLALPLVKSGGLLFASTNAANWPAEEFIEGLKAEVHVAARRIAQLQFVPQPPDFPISRAEPGYLKTVWMRIS